MNIKHITQNKGPRAHTDMIPTFTMHTKKTVLITQRKYLVNLLVVVLRNLQFLPKYSMLQYFFSQDKHKIGIPVDRQPIITT